MIVRNQLAKTLAVIVPFPLHLSVSNAPPAEEKQKSESWLGMKITVNSILLKHKEK